MTALLDAPSREARLFALCHLNDALFLRRYWTDDLPPGAKPTAKQVGLWMDRSTRVAAITGRKVMKTTLIESRIIGSAFRNPTMKRKECLFTTPGESQMNPVMVRVEARIQGTPLFSAMLKSYSKNDQVLEWRNRTSWYMRIEGVDGTGRNMVGLHADEIIGDEQAFGAQKAHDARLQVANDPVETRWLYAGVPNGVRMTPFFKIDQDKEAGSAWSIHRMNSFENPHMGNPAAKLELATMYGGVNSNEYLNNVLGLWGEARASTFPIAHLAASASPNQPFVALEISEGEAQAAKQSEDARIPWSTLLTSVEAAARTVGERADGCVLGIDHGFSPDPTVIYLFYRDKMQTARGNHEVWRALACITVLRIIATEQAHLIDDLRTMLDDALGGGLLMICADMMNYTQATYTDNLWLDTLRFDVEWYREHAVAAAFGSSDVPRDAHGAEIADFTGEKTSRSRKQSSTEMLKESFALNMADPEATRFLG